MPELLPAVEVEGPGLSGGHPLPAGALDVGGAVLLVAGRLTLPGQTAHNKRTGYIEKGDQTDYPEIPDKEETSDSPASLRTHSDR